MEDGQTPIAPSNSLTCSECIRGVRVEARGFGLGISVMRAIGCCESPKGDWWMLPSPCLKAWEKGLSGA